MSSLSYFKVHVYHFRGLSNFKQYLSFDRSPYQPSPASSYSLSSAFDSRKYKLFNPLVFDPPTNFIEFKNGTNWVIATKISIQRYMNDMTE